MKFSFPVFLIDLSLRSSQSNARTTAQELIRALQAHDLSVISLENFADDLAGQSFQQASAFVFCLPCAEMDGDSEKAAIEAEKALLGIRARNENVPVFLLGAKGSASRQGSDLLKDVQVFEESCASSATKLAKRISSEAADYVSNLAPPFFKALLKYAESRADSWHCPGHSGGAAFLKSPVGSLFHQFYGENLLRTDVCNAVEDLGQLLDHKGPIAESEKKAAQVFQADHCYFVTNGTSTSNKIVWNSTVAEDDIVIVDRNCHKSNLHAIIMTGAIPVFLTPTRNHHGLIGPIPAHQFSPEAIRKKIESHPLIHDKNKKPRLLTITQSTYDGISYNAERIKQRLDGHINALHFDEAWIPHAPFHPFYRDMHAIGEGRKRAEHSLVFSTQSTHKMLTGLSQASQILVQNAENKKLNHHAFNEAFLMHTSTSPQYSIIASCDVAAAMMAGPSGKILIEESLNEALSFRRALQEMGRGFDSAHWFRIWGPPEGTERGLSDRNSWLLKPEDTWHGFEEIEAGFNLIDPLRTTILTPGLNFDGTFEKEGIPATLVAKFLAEHGVIVEKCGLYSFFIMFTLGTSRRRWTSLLAALQDFRKAWIENQSVATALPRWAEQHPSYGALGLRTLGLRIHSLYRESNVARVTTAAYTSEIVPGMKPAAASAKLAHEEIERVPIDELEGRTTAVLLTPYPPGIPLLIPGEKFNKSIVDYLKFTRDFNEKIPGFETDVHGLVVELRNGKWLNFVDCVKEAPK